MKIIITLFTIVIFNTLSAQTNPVFGKWRSGSTSNVKGGTYTEVCLKFQKKYNDLDFQKKYEYYIQSPDNYSFEIKKDCILYMQGSQAKGTTGKINTKTNEIEFPVRHINTPHTHLYKILNCDADILIIERKQKECFKCCLK